MAFHKNEPLFLSRACAELVEVSSEESLRRFSSKVMGILHYVQDDTLLIWNFIPKTYIVPSQLLYKTHKISRIWL